VIGPDNNVYLIVGDVGGRMGNIQNIMRGNSPDGTSGILRVTQDGKSVDNGTFGNSVPNTLYYAYGIRNSFGFDFDPVTGNLWDSEMVELIG
jgi:Glucose/sorbosone dehydrogenases